MDVPGELRPGVRLPADPEGLASLDTGRESPAGPTVKVGPCPGRGWTTPDMSETDDGREEGLCDAALGCGGCCCPCTDESMDVGGGSCGGETWGVIMAGSLDSFLCCVTAPCLSSREDVPAGVSGGECIDDWTWEEWADPVRETGEGDGALCMC